MRVTSLGPSGIRVSELVLGTATFGNQDWGCSADESQRIYEAYREAGGNFIDTANKYAAGESERIVGDLVQSCRDEIVIGTKYTAAHPHRFDDDPNAFGNHAKSLRRSLLRSLERLRTDYIDILWVHAWDRRTSIVEFMRALDAQVRSGKVLAIGASNFPAWVVARANAIAEIRGWTPFSAIQVEYSLVERGAELELLPMADHHGLASLAWAPLAWGILTGKYANAANESGRLEPDHPKRDQRADEITSEVRAIAHHRGLSSPQVALAWIRGRPYSPLTLLGARTEKQLRENLGMLDVTLERSDLQRLEQVSSIRRGVPGDFLSSDDGIEFFYGSTGLGPVEVGDV